MGHHSHHHHGSHQQASSAVQGPAYGSAQPYGVMQAYPQNGRMDQLRAQEEKHKKHEHLAEAVALGAGAFAAYEHHKIKTDPQHAGRHQREEHIAGAVAAGAGSYALYEHHQVRQDHHQLKKEKKHHHGLFH